MKHAILINAVADINGASFVGIDTHTDVPLLGGKGNPMQGRVTKRMVGATVMSFQNKNFSAYEAMVKRRLDAEGKDPADFVLSPRAWGTRIPNMPIVEHKGNYYLEVIFLKAGVSQYLLDGNPIAASDIIGLKPAAAGEQGGLENKVFIRTFAADSIVELRIDGKVVR
jgi:hypothetical protein